MTLPDIAARLKQTCVLFQGDDGSIGSGYLIAPGHAATAAHVVRRRAVGESFEVLVGWPPQRRPAMATLLGVDRVADAALLRVAGCDDIEPLPVGQARGDDMWRSFGFPVAMSHDRDKVNGVHLSGRIIDMHYADIDGTPQIALYNQEALTRMDMRGASGAPLVVGGGIVGHLAQQYADVDNVAQSVSGQLKACPIKPVLALLPPGVHTRRVAVVEAPAADVDVGELVSWCDRVDVVEQLDDWLDKGDGGARLMCVAGHSDHRYVPLLNRIARQLSERKVRQVWTEACHVLDAVALGKQAQFRRAVETALNAPFDRIDSSLSFRGSAGLVLLSQCCDWPVGPVREMEKHLLQVAEWLAGLQLGQRRLVLVLSLRYDDGEVHAKAVSTIRKTVAGLHKKHETMRSVLLGKPVILGDYRSGEVRNWIQLPLIKTQLGRNADRIEGALDEQYANETWNARKLHRLVKTSLEGDRNG